MMKKMALLTLSCLLFTASAQAISWDISGLTDEGGWSSWQGNKIAIVFYLNGVEIGRVWDNPANRTADIPVSLPQRYELSGRLLAYPSPFPVTPTGSFTEIAKKYSRRMRVLDDNTTAEIKQNRVRGRGRVSFGPTR